MSKTCLSPQWPFTPGRILPKGHNVRTQWSVGCLFLLLLWFWWRKKKMKERRDGETEHLVSSPPVEEILIWTEVWERQSRQLGARQDADRLLGRMQAKGIVGNYTGLKLGSNALIQQDIFIKEQGWWMGTTREKETSANPFLLLPRMNTTEAILSTLWSFFETFVLHMGRAGWR